tara:strand:+ start:1641 stop:2366 length:726 start_codon:yes stop_codon:yes gene_type:complete
MLPVKERDLLEQDPPIRGQNYACLSFISPEEVLKNKEAFYFENYIQHFSAKVNELFTGLEKSYADESDKFRSIKEEFEYLFDPDKINDAYKNFTAANTDVLNKEFDTKNEFQTSIRGLKIRGVYDSVPEAQARCEQLRKIDADKFNIFISEVGMWCPWSPNPNDIKDQEFALDSLNTLIHEYDKNTENKNAHYAERKRDLQERIAENERAKVNAREESNDNLDSVKEVFNQEEPSHIRHQQ